MLPILIYYMAENIIYFSRPQNRKQKTEMSNLFIKEPETSSNNFFCVISTDCHLWKTFRRRQQGWHEDGGTIG
jgi:hypothetical protein